MMTDVTERGPSKAVITILSLNVDGRLDERQKIESINKILRLESLDFLFLQEINISKANQILNSFQPLYKGFVLPKSRDLIEREYIQKEYTRIKKESPNDNETKILSKIDKSRAKASGGVAIYSHKKWMDKVKLLKEDKKLFRYIALTMQESTDEILLLISLYGPSEGPSKSDPFFRELSADIEEMKKGIRNGN